MENTPNQKRSKRRKRSNPTAANPSNQTAKHQAKQTQSSRTSPLQVSRVNPTSPLTALGIELNAEAARKAIILSEIIGKPVSKRRIR